MTSGTLFVLYTKLQISASYQLKAHRLELEERTSSYFWIVWYLKENNVQSCGATK